MKDYFNKVYNKGKKNFYKMLEDNLNNNVKTFVITSNPETFIMGKKDIDFDKVKVYNDKYIKSGDLCINKDIKRLSFFDLYLKNIISTFSGNL